MKKTLLKWFKTWNLEHLTLLMGIVGHFASYIQAMKIFYLHSAYAVSLMACLIGLASMVCWLLYGMEKNIKPLIISNVFGMIGVLLVTAGVLYYG